MAPTKDAQSVSLKLDEVLSKFDTLSAEFQDCKHAVDRLSQASGNGVPRGRGMPPTTESDEEYDYVSNVGLNARRQYPAQGSQSRTRQNRAFGLPASFDEGDVTQVNTEQINADYQSIVDSLQKIRLPSSLKVNIGQGRGIKRDDQPMVNILRKCGQFAETLIKLLSQLSEDKVTEEDLKDLFVLALTQLRYVQDKYTVVTLQGTFGKKVANLYENIEHNPGAYRQQNLEAVRAAVGLVAAEQQHNQQPRGAFGYTPQHPFRPSYNRGGFQPRFGPRRGFDPYQRFERVPSFRGPRPSAPTNDNNSGDNYTSH